MLPESKRVSDPVHGTIGLTDLEVRVIDTRAFQRLRSVKQLGLANLVFPGADFSRLSHCLGVCHVIGMALDALSRNGVEIDPKEERLYRVAGLLHDVGHYPYSHLMERAVENHYKGSLIVPEPDGVPGVPIENEADEGDRFFSHERVGREILERDGDLRQVLSS